MTRSMRVSLQDNILVAVSYGIGLCTEVLSLGNMRVSLYDNILVAGSYGIGLCTEVLSLVEYESEFVG